MSGYLLDTNVVSELTKNVPHPQIMAFLAEQHDLWLSAMVLHELEFGLQLLSPGQRLDGLRAVLSGFITGYEGRIPALGEDRSRVGRPISGAGNSLRSRAGPGRCAHRRYRQGP